MNIGNLTRVAMLTLVLPIALPSFALAQHYRHHRDYDDRDEGPDEGDTRTFDHPKVGGVLLDGCYQYPGDCHTRREAQAYCRSKGYDEAVDWDAKNRGGLFQTKRLGDGGTCFASCTVMTSVTCQ